MKVPTGSRIVIPRIEGLRPLSQEYMRAYEELNTEQGKSRAERARVVSRTKDSGKRPLFSIQKAYTQLRYEVGKRVVPHNGFSANAVQCAAGIHCFLTRGKARRYDL